MVRFTNLPHHRSVCKCRDFRDCVLVSTYNSQTWQLYLLVLTTVKPDLDNWKLKKNRWITSLRKQPTFGDATTGFPAKWRLRNERRNSILMTRHYPDLGSASDWSCRVGNLIRPTRDTTQIWVVTCHHYGISALVSELSFGGETSGIAKCRLFSQAIEWPIPQLSITLWSAYGGYAKA